MRLSEHYCRVAACRVDLDAAIQCQRHSLTRHDDVSIAEFADPQDAVAWLQPLRTFPKRFLVWQEAEWAFVASDCILEPCVTDVLYMSKKCGSTATVGSYLEGDRRFFEISRGLVRRELSCIKEGGLWEWQERGDRQPYESQRASTASTLRRRSERLTPALVCLYLAAITGLVFSGPKSPLGQRIVGFERAWRHVTQAPLEVDTYNDLAH
jgi:hypothetical protein